MADSSWRLIRALVRPHRRLVFAFGVVLAAATAVSLAASVLLGRFVRLAVDGAPTGRLVRLAVAYALTGLVSAALSVAVTWRATVAAWGITNGLRHDLADYVLSADLAFHRDRTPGELVTRVDGDITSMTEFFATVVAQVIAIVVLMVGAVIVAIAVEPLLALPMIAAFIGVGGVTAFVRDMPIEETVAERAAEADVMSAAEQYFAGADDIAALGGGLHGVARVGERSGRMVAAARARVRKQMTMQGSIRVSIAMAEVLMIGVGAALTKAGRIDVAGVVLGFRLVGAVGGKVDHLTWRLQDAQGASGAARRVLELVGAQQIVRGGTASLPVGPMPVVFERAELVYDDAEGTSAAVCELTLTMAPGRLLGVLGRTGSGKTSIARLLLRLVEPSGGRVLIGGVDITTIDEDDFRRRVTAIPQDVQLFPGTVFDNVALFADATRDDVTEALADAGLGEWLASLPQGLDTRLSSDDRSDEGSRVGLSGGQAQLLALARALLRRPTVVVLDEATSRIDPATQDSIGQAMRRLVAGRTAMVIAHRLETLDLCDDIAVLADGALVEHGARTALAADPESRYARLRSIGASEELV